MKKAKWTISVCDAKKMGNGTAACTRQFGSNTTALILVHTVCREFIFPLPEARSGKKKKGSSMLIFIPRTITRSLLALYLNLRDNECELVCTFFFLEPAAKMKVPVIFHFAPQIL